MGPGDSPYRHRVPRSHRRVLLALLSGADNLGGYEIARAAQVGPAKPYTVLPRLEHLGWVTSEQETPVPANRPRRRFYRLTPGGRTRVMELLGLAVREKVS
jgi:DNA-binding PadR family transcriptional regulator